MVCFVFAVGVFCTYLSSEVVTLRLNDIHFPVIWGGGGCFSINAIKMNSMIYDQMRIEVLLCQ